MQDANIREGGMKGEQDLLYFFFLFYNFLRIYNYFKMKILKQVNKQK